jgi:hypothetical protein
MRLLPYSTGHILAYDIAKWGPNRFYIVSFTGSLALILTVHSFVSRHTYHSRIIACWFPLVEADHLMEAHGTYDLKFLFLNSWRFDSILELMDNVLATFISFFKHGPASI